MTSIKTLPLLGGTKLIVLDEGLNSTYARKLIAGWIKIWKDKDPNHTFNLLLFSDSKSSYQKEPESFISNNVNIYDYYTLDINEIDISDINEKDFYSLKHILNIINTKSTVIIDCITCLILFVGLPKTIWFLKKLSKQVPQLICIYRRDIVQNKILCIETLGSTYIKIQNFSDAVVNKNFNYVVKFIHHKIGGGILKQEEIINQNDTSYDIQSKKLERNKRENSLSDNYKLKIESSFRIEINENEMKQRKETVLPYIIKTDVTNTSKIHYHPEDIDDIDEEDPDDDLCF
ncbi:PREDICTED: elongator complex protein 5 [Eufriesea mexicana]|uniref:elongator complex protein 5 n=1 Tax=Eufriesea mexicana TaxID=516756 RepID=UPI00083BF99E|nr:PREDICTED: elongator complex protein 5 [Eufriesea mexicana]